MSCFTVGFHCVFRYTYGFFFQQLLRFISLRFEVLKAIAMLPTLQISQLFSRRKAGDVIFGYVFPDVK